ncbi:hypothetical protein HMPREF3038_00552 [Akkermansia sp. KLE1797]|nr:hypothetical protein HMPREF3038_00552 [Akkermansia sp. KLE1797]KXU55388.1 hypothetical protein HMPREF3039_00495 [Akkermansia sp. KLE1798]
MAAFFHLLSHGSFRHEGWRAPVIPPGNSDREYRHGKRLEKGSRA